MLKQVSICAALLAFATGSGNAQQREAILQKIEVPGTGFDLVIATPKPGGQTYDLSASPEALVVHLIGGDLALAFEDPWQMVKTFDYLRRPIEAFHVDSPTQVPHPYWAILANNSGVCRAANNSRACISRTWPSQLGSVASISRCPRYVRFARKRDTAGLSAEAVVEQSQQGGPLFDHLVGERCETGVASHDTPER